MPTKITLTLYSVAKLLLFKHFMFYYKQYRTKSSNNNFRGEFLVNRLKIERGKTNYLSLEYSKVCTTMTFQYDLNLVLYSKYRKI